MRSDLHDNMQQEMQAGPDPGDEQMRPDWTKKCEVCGETPIVPLTGMCGPCTFGEVNGGNAWAVTDQVIEVLLDEDSGVIRESPRNG